MGEEKKKEEKSALPGAGEEPSIKEEKEAVPAFRSVDHNTCQTCSCSAIL